MAHKGVLFLDELPEMKRETLEILRQPLEDGEIHIARVGGRYSFPAEFLLVGAMNPCPCGYYPDRNRCDCGEHEIKRYQQRISQAFLDRMDICVTTMRQLMVNSGERYLTVTVYSGVQKICERSRESPVNTKRTFKRIRNLL